MILDTEERKTQSLIALARNYYAGDQIVYLTDRQAAWLALHGHDVSFNVNVSAMVVDAVVERLSVLGFKTSDPELATAVDSWWRLARMDALSAEVHLYGVRDGEELVIADWNAAENRPDYILHPRYVDKTAGGDSFGVWMEYADGNVYGRAERAAKRWSDLDERGSVRERMTVYYPERIEKFYLAGGQWKPLEIEGEAWPLPWTSNGQPIGIPVAHFRNPGQESELKNIVPIQDALNKSWIDLLASADNSAFRLLVALGFVPTTDGAEPKSDGSNLLKILPGQMLATRKKPGEADLKSIEPSDLDSLLNLEERLVYKIASISSTPLSRFKVTGQVASEGTLKQQEGPLLAKIEKRQILFGDAWEDLMHISTRLSNAFGGTALDDDADLETLWRPAATRDETDELNRADIKKNKLGVPTETIWSEIGYTAEQSMAMKETPEFKNLTFGNYP